MNHLEKAIKAAGGQEDFALELGFSTKASVNAIEKGRNKPTFETMGNQFFGKVASQHIVDSRCIVAVNIQDLAHPLHVSITMRSAERLRLITE